MTDIIILKEALAKYGIEAPEKYNFDVDGFTTWGTFDRFWAKDIVGGFVIGNFDTHEHYSVLQNEETLSTTLKRIYTDKIQEEIAHQEDLSPGHDRYYSEKASDIWNNIKDSNVINHPYLLKNNIKGFRCKQVEDKLVFPIYDTTSNICNLLYIDENGNKQFLEGKKRGCYIPIGVVSQNNKIIVCDDYVTGAKIHEETGETVAIAFDPKNLEPVKQALLEKYPDYEINIVSDTNLKEIAPSAATNEAMDVFDQYNTDICTSNSENSQEKCDSDDLTEQVITEPAKEEIEPIENVEKTNQQMPKGYIFKDNELHLEIEGKSSVKVSDKIEVLAEARDTESNNWGKVVRFMDHDNNTKTLLINNTKFITSGNELEEILCYNGLYISKPKELKKYLNDYKTKNRALCVDKIGWCNESFVFPDGSIIGKNNENIIYYGNNTPKEFETIGTLEDWRNNVGQYCQGNSRLILAVGAAFAGTLLNITGQENGGFHFVGNSTVGKTTILNVACSVFSDRNFMKTWRATDNGLEGIASTRNDTLLVLDELGQVDPNKAGEIAYMLGNGNGKIRSTKNGTAKKSFTWRILYLSSGEKNLNDCAMESKKTVKAGQEVRLLNIPAQPDGDSFGAFENVHDKKTGKAFSEYLNSAVKEYHGTAAREFIQCIVNDGFEKIANDFRNFLYNAEQKYFPSNADNQVKRAFNRFMLIAFAGEYATEHGITGWNKEESLKACVTCFKAWIQERGGVKDHEIRALLKQVRHYFELYSNSRFLDMNGISSYIPNKAGYKRKDIEKTYYFVCREVFEEEICKNFNFNQAKDILLRKGWLKDFKSDTQYFKGERERVYTLTDKILSDEDVDN